MTKQTDSTVVRLPTAAKRKPKGWLTKAERKAAEQLPQFPDIHLFPCQREANAIAEQMAAGFADPSLTALRLVVAMFRVMPEAKKRLVEMYLTVEAGREVKCSKSALAFVQFEQADTFRKAQIANRLVDMMELGL